MKKTNFQRILSFILALVMLVGMVSINVFATETEEQNETAVEVMSKNIYFGETINLMFAIPTASVEGANVEITAQMGESTYSVTAMDPETVKGVACNVYKVTTGVSAQNIDAVYTVTVKVDGVEASSFTYSVLEYLYERLYISEGVSDAQKTMYNNLIAYADSADKVLNKDETGIADKYVYVNAVDCTFDGGKTAGIVEKNTTLNFATDLVPGANQYLQYNIAALGASDNTTKTPEEMAAGYVPATNCQVTAQLVDNEAPAVEPGTTTYTFSNYTAGTQYAENEEHALDANVTLVTTQCYFTTDLRMYSSGTHDGYAIVKSVLPISTVGVNAGNAADTLVIYGSNDEGATWTEAATIAVTSAYADHSVELASTYKWIKLDVAGTQQVRIKTMTLTTVVDCAHANTTTSEEAPTCTEPGYTVTKCTDCGITVSKVESAAANGHTDTTPVDHNCDVCGTEGITDHIDEDGDTVCDNGCDVVIPSGTSAQEYTKELAIYGTTGSLSSSIITWTDGDLTVTNAKGSTAIRTSDSDHYRVYANSTLTIAVDGGAIKTVVITCTSSSYATVLGNSLTTSGVTATVSGSTVTVTVESGTFDSIIFTATAQTRINKVEVTYTK
ncbi:MAG: hypothetical protein IJW03_02750 [Clostridia bacterium]|nr:hypothetical protein [Clostridia bacterium]